MRKLYDSLFLNDRLFYGLSVVVIVFVLGFFIPLFFTIGKITLFSLIICTIVDTIFLYIVSNGIQSTRIAPEKLSNGDRNTITISIVSNYRFYIYAKVIDEIPFQFQKFDALFKRLLSPKEENNIRYTLIPKERGIYDFGNINVYVSTPFRLAVRKYVLGEAKKIKCYPSFLKLGEFNVLADTTNLYSYGTNKIRRIGHSLEFEQIKEYIAGDDIRTLNWKATAKRNQLMVNQYVEEKSQPVYSIIDKGRTMQMNFNELTLLDYAINATLAVSNAILKKQDKAGMLTFSKKLENLVVAEQRRSQMRLISEALYNVTTNFLEADYSLLYNTLKRKITTRSLLLLYTNFDTLDALHRQLPFLRAVAKNHVLVVIFFENTELDKIANQKAVKLADVYDKTIAEKFMYEKKQIANELQKYGIQSILTKPEQLTGNAINKYLEIKSRGLF